MTKLRYCDKTLESDIVTEQESSLAITTRQCPAHAIRKAKSLHTVLLLFQAKKY